MKKLWPKNTIAKLVVTWAFVVIVVLVVGLVLEKMFF